MTFPLRMLPLRVPKIRASYRLKLLVLNDKLSLAGWLTAAGAGVLLLTDGRLWALAGCC
jgi:hypothetical protein